MWGHQVGKTNLLLIAKYENHTSITKFVHHPSVVFYMLHDFFLIPLLLQLLSVQLKLSNLLLACIPLPNGATCRLYLST